MWENPKVHLIDGLGRIYPIVLNEEFSISTEGLAEGVYLIKFEENGIQQNLKLIIQH